MLLTKRIMNTEMSPSLSSGGASHCVDGHGGSVG